MTRRLLISVLVLGMALGIGSVPATAQAADASVQAKMNAKSKRKPFPIGGAVVVDQAVGIGTFVKGSERRTSYSWTLSLRPVWRISKKQSLSARFDLSQEVVQNSDSSTTKKRQLLPSDVTLTYQYANVYKIPVVGIGITPYAQLGLPSSLDSRFRKKILDLRAGAMFGWSKRWASLSWNTRLAKNFNRFTSPVVGRSQNVTSARVRGNEEVAADLIAVGGNNVELSWLNQLTFTAKLPANFTLTVDYVFLKAWTYATSSQGNDALRAQNADTGRGVRDVQQGTVELGWTSPLDFLSFGLGVTTLQPPKQADNSGFRFPFFDFTSPANNFTSVYLDVVASF